MYKKKQKEAKFSFFFLAVSRYLRIFALPSMRSLRLPLPMLLAATGHCTMWIAVFGDVGIAVLNAMRTLNTAPHGNMHAV